LLLSVQEEQEEEEEGSEITLRGKREVVDVSNFVIVLSPSVAFFAVRIGPRNLDFGKSHGNCGGRKTAGSPIPKVSHRAQFWIFF
jgi:hypothetical protein